MIEESTVRAKLQDCAAAVRATNPMAPSITNFVTIDFVANAQLAVGGGDYHLRLGLVHGFFAAGDDDNVPRARAGAVAPGGQIFCDAHNFS